MEDGGLNGTKPWLQSVTEEKARSSSPPGDLGMGVASTGQTREKVSSIGWVRINSGRSSRGGN